MSRGFQGHLSRPPAIKMLLLLVIAVAALTIVYLTPIRQLIDLDRLPQWQEWLNQWGWRAPVWYIFVGALLLSMGVPRVVYCALGGALFGFWAGLVWANLGSIIGSVGGFVVARILGREWVYLRWGNRYPQLERRLNHNGFLVILLVRLCPITNNFLINGLAGISMVRWWAFILGSAIGFLPSSIFLVLMGSGVAVADHIRTGMGLLLFITATLLTLRYFRSSAITAQVMKELIGRDQLDPVADNDSSASTS
jgi:uncharacterized membrane protein YdjX (TVP38/TMEM64 family)